MHWGGDDWGPMVSDEEPADTEGLLCESVGSRPKTEVAEVVKVRITKRQLEELLGRVDLKELSVHQAVALLLTSAASPTHHRPWRPALQSIPEAN